MRFYIAKFKKIRKQNRWSIAGLAKAIGVSRQTVSKWENNKTIPSSQMVKKLAKILQVDIYEISDLKEISNDKVSNNKSILNSQLIEDINNREKLETIINNLNDITKAIEKSSMLIDALFIHSHFILYLKDTNQKYSIVSRNYLHYLGLNTDFSVDGKFDKDFYSIEEAEINTKEDAQVIHTGKPVVNVERYIPGTRKKKWGLISKIPILNKENRVTNLLGVITDITTKKEREDYLKKFEYAISKMLNENVFIAEGLNEDLNNPIIFKKILYSSVPKQDDKNYNLFWGNMKKENFEIKKIILTWRKAMTEETIKASIEFKKKLQFPYSRQYTVKSPITGKKLLVSENVKYDSKLKLYIGTISFITDIIYQEVLEQIINNSFRIIVWIGNTNIKEQKLRYQYLKILKMLLATDTMKI